MRYSVRYEIRQQGAIGVFEWGSFVVEADSEEAAHAAGFDLAHAKGYETRGGPIIQRIPD